MNTTQTIALATVSFITTISAASTSIIRCIDFEDLPAGATYNIGDTFSTSGINAEVFPHAGDAQAKINVYGLAGTGHEMYPNNVAVEFDAASSGLGYAVRAKFDYWEGGGINVMEVNGSVISFPNFFDFGPLNGSTWPSALGNVTLNVTESPTTGGFLGTVEIIGDIKSLRVGGQELVIDNVCFEYPETNTAQCCEGDSNQDGQVNFQDLISVISNWGSQCP